MGLWPTRIGLISYCCISCKQNIWKSSGQSTYGRMVKTISFSIGCKKRFAISPSSAGMSISPNLSWPGTGKSLTCFLQCRVPRVWSVIYRMFSWGTRSLNPSPPGAPQFQGCTQRSTVQKNTVVRNRFQFSLDIIDIRALFGTLSDPRDIKSGEWGQGWIFLQVAVHVVNSWYYAMVLHAVSTRISRLVMRWGIMDNRKKK